MAEPKREPLSDLAQHIFDMVVRMNKVYAAGLGIPVPEHHAQVERMQAKYEGPPFQPLSPIPRKIGPDLEFERSAPSLPEGKAACERLSCQRIVDQEELSERGWCPQCEKLDLTRAQLRKGAV